MIVAVIAVAVVAGCGSSDSDVDIYATNFEPGLEMRDGVRILRLKGTAYEMGQQHAQLMHDELLEGVSFMENSELGLLEHIARNFGFLDEALSQSYPDAKNECQGMADEMGDDGWTMDRCMALAYGEVILDFFEAGLLACSQFAVTGPAGADPDILLHGRNLVWDNIEYLLKFPTIIVRAPTDLIPKNRKIIFC